MSFYNNNYRQPQFQAVTAEQHQLRPATVGPSRLEQMPILELPADLSSRQQRHQQQLPIDPDQNSDSDQNNSDHIFGPFAGLAKPFGNDGSTSTTNLAKNAIFMGSLILLIARALLYVTEMFRSPNLSLDWAHSSLQVSITLNAIGSLIWLRNGTHAGEFADALSKAVGQNRPPTLPKRALFNSILLALLCMITLILWALLRVLKLQIGEMSPKMNGNFTEENLEEMHIMANRSVVILDAFVAIMAGYFSALALALFYLSFQSVLAQWDAFKREKFDTIVGKNAITDPNVLAGLDDSASPLLRFAHFTSNKLEHLGMGLFMTAVFCNIAASFITAGGGESATRDPEGAPNWFHLLTSINNICWSILSMVLLVNVIKGPYDVHSKIREIKEELLLEDSIWKSTDPKTLSIAQNLVMRIDGVRIHRIGSQLFQLIFVGQMVLVSLLVSGSNCGHSNQPPYNGTYHRH